MADTDSAADEQAGETVADDSVQWRVNGLENRLLRVEGNVRLLEDRERWARLDKQEDGQALAFYLLFLFGVVIGVALARRRLEIDVKP